ncbi:MAG: tetratricopeptide repeat protein, partial [bacterium]
ATQVNPENKDPFFNLGYYYQRQEKYDQAEETFQNILNIDPNNKEAKKALDNIKDKRKKTKEKI